MLRPFVHRFDSSIPFFFAANIHRWSHEWELEKLCLGGGGTWSTSGTDSSTSGVYAASTRVFPAAIL